MQHKTQFDSTTILAAARARQTELQGELRRIETLIGVFGEGEASNEAPRRSGRGRPKGSKNRAKKARAAAKPAVRGKRGRPSKAAPTAKKVVRTARASRKPATPRAKGMSLIRAVAQVLAESEAPLSVTQIADGVSKLGVNTKASSFKTMVSQSLGKLSELKVVESTERGVWQSSNGISKYLGDEGVAAPVAAAADEIPI